MMSMMHQSTVNDDDGVDDDADGDEWLEWSTIVLMTNDTHDDSMADSNSYHSRFHCDLYQCYSCSHSHSHPHCAIQPIMNNAVEQRSMMNDWLHVEMMDDRDGRHWQKTETMTQPIYQRHQQHELPPHAIENWL